MYLFWRKRVGGIIILSPAACLTAVSAYVNRLTCVGTCVYADFLLSLPLSLSLSLALYLSLSLSLSPSLPPSLLLCQSIILIHLLGDTDIHKSLAFLSISLLVLLSSLSQHHHLIQSLVRPWASQETNLSAINLRSSGLLSSLSLWTHKRVWEAVSRTSDLSVSNSMPSTP